jgi:hypothetical protein
MANHDHAVDLHAQRKNFYLEFTPTMRGGVILFIFLGLVGLVIGLNQPPEHQPRVWGALLFNAFFFFALSLGGSAFSAMQDVIGAKWGRPVMRIHESFSSFLPIAGFLLVSVMVAAKFSFAGARDVWIWVKDPGFIHHFWGKRDWLSENFWIIRDVVAVLVILLVAHWQIGMKTRRDVAFAEGNPEAGAMAIKVQETLRYWSAPILVIYALMFSLLGFDMLKSLSPKWFSTLWGGWLFAIMMQTLMATLLLSMWALKGTNIGSIIKRQQFHDVGKLMHGFSVFFAYLTYAHILTYWYGNMPEETEYFIHRLHAPWIYIVIAAPIFSFLIPLYGMIPKASKWTKMIGGSIAVGILVAQWFTYMLVVQAEVVKADNMGLPWVELAMFFGVFGLFALSVFRFGQRIPMVAVGDPLLREALKESAH